MQHYRSLEDITLSGAWLTIGSFDGVHKGHQTIIHQITAGAQANGVPAVVISFHPHPAAVLHGQNFPYYLTTPEEKAEILERLGVDILITHPFNRDVANQTARQFLSQIRQNLTVNHIQVGYDFAMGKNRDGDFSTLQELGKELGFTVDQSPPILDEDGAISSSRIRFLLGVGQVEKAAVLLGRNYQLQGIVEVGDRRGQGLGFPTANLSVWAEKIIPTAGVYACWAFVQGEKWPAVTNIGVRPTFEKKPVAPRVEAHLLDFRRDIYGESLRLEFVSRLRDERRFQSIEALINQISKDSQQAREFLSA
jgi:riboflavin kinase/FMN adenylyltransferase